MDFKISLLCAIFLLDFLRINIAAAQPDFRNVRFRHLTVDDGLPQSSVLSILQDQQGFMWFGTGDGLVRYDGNNFTVFKNNPADSSSLHYNSILCMVEDDDGMIWIGHRSQGIEKYNPRSGKFTHFLHHKNDSASLIHDDIRALCKDSSGNIWIGTAMGLNIYNPDKNNFTWFDSDPATPGDVPIWALHAGGNNTLWIGVYFGGGMAVFNTRTKKFTKRYLPVENDPASISDHYIVSITEDHNGILWIGTRDRGLNAFDPSSGKFTRFFSSTDPNSLSGDDLWSDILVDSRNDVWIGTYNRGLNIFNRGKNNFTRYLFNPVNPGSINGNSVRSLYEDKGGVIWVGTTAGLNIYNPQEDMFRVYKNIPGMPESFHGKEVVCITEDKHGNIWIGNWSSGVDMLDVNTGKFTHYENDPLLKGSLPNNAVRGIAMDRNGVIHIATFGNGVCSYDEKTQRFIVDESGEGINWAKDMFTDHKNRLWLNFYGLMVFDTEAKEWMRCKPQPADSMPEWGNNISGIYPDRENNVWLVYNKALFRYSITTGNFSSIRNIPSEINSLPDESIFFVYQDSRYRYWLGTGYGLYWFDINARKFAAHYTEEDGLPNNLVSSVIEDRKGNLWLTTNKGLSMFDPVTKTFTNYDITDGLPNNEFNSAYHTDKNGRMYFGTMNGFISFDPEKFIRNTHIPPVAITGLTVLNKPWRLPQKINFTGEITLSYREYFFTLEFASLDYAAPQKNRYAYRMEGFNPTWIYAGNKREATFTNLDPGEYTFRVIASNNHGLWNEEGASLKIIITPPWWKTKTFYASCIIAMMLMIYGYIKFRERKLRLEKKILEIKVNKATAEIRNQKEVIEEKNKNITDSIEYAKRIQDAIMPSMDELEKVSAGSFIFHNQRDIIGGDFYFITEVNGWKIVALADCTGHGVPGALMSMLGKDMLNEIVNDRQVTLAGQALDMLDSRVTDALNPDKSVELKVKDGMDIAFVAMKSRADCQLALQFAGARRPLVIADAVGSPSNPVRVIKGDERSIGGERYTGRSFSTHDLEIKSGSMLYIFTDGFSDQLGGPKQKKFKTKNLMQLFSDIASKPVEEQRQIVEKTFTEWKGEYEQTDDVTVIGIKV